MLCWWQTEKLALRPMSGGGGESASVQLQYWFVHRNCVSMCHAKGNGYYLVAGFVRNVLLYGNYKSIHVIVVTSFYVESGESPEWTFRITTTEE